MNADNYRDYAWVDGNPYPELTEPPGIPGVIVDPTTPADGETSAVRI